MPETQETIHNLLGAQSKEIATEVVQKFSLLAQAVELQTGARALDSELNGNQPSKNAELEIEDTAKSIVGLLKLGLGVLSHINDNTEIDVKSLIDGVVALPSSNAVIELETPANDMSLGVGSKKVVTSETKSGTNSSSREIAVYSPDRLHQDFIDSNDIVNLVSDDDPSLVKLSLQDNRFIEADNTLLSLKDNELFLLNILFLNRNKLITRKFLLDHGYSPSSSSDAARGQSLRHNRIKFKSHFPNIDLIETVGEGAHSKYRLSPNIFIIDERTRDAEMAPEKLKKN